MVDGLAPLGARPAGARQARIARPPHWRDGAFQNPVATRTVAPGSTWQTLRLELTGGEQRVPPAPRGPPCAGSPR